MLVKEKFLISAAERHLYQKANESKGTSGCLIALAGLGGVLAIIGYTFVDVAPLLVYILASAVIAIAILVLIWGLWYRHRWQYEGIEYKGVVINKWHRYLLKENDFIYHVEFESESIQVDQETYQSIQEFDREYTIRSYPIWGSIKNIFPQKYIYPFTRSGSRDIDNGEKIFLEQYIRAKKFKRAIAILPLQQDYQEEILYQDLEGMSLDVYSTYITDKQICDIPSWGLGTRSVEQYWIYTPMGQIHIHAEVFTRLRCGTAIQVYTMPRSGLIVPFFTIADRIYGAMPVPNGKDKSNLDLEYD